MITIPKMLVLAFAIGLTGALSPGPTLVATIDLSLRKGWRTGPIIVAGHMVVEFLIALLIVLGMGAMAEGYTDQITLAGGPALVVFGLLTIKESRTASLKAGGEISGSPFVAGILTSIANPSFIIWWLTIGSGFLLDGLRGGVLLAAAFMAGHWAADLGWYTLVSTSVDRGRTLLSESKYRLLLRLCGVFLILFGLVYFLSVVI